MRFRIWKTYRSKDTEIIFWKKIIWLEGLLSLKVMYPYRTFVFRILWFPILYSKQKNDSIYYKVLGLYIFKWKSGKRFFRNFCIALHNAYPQYNEFYIFMSKSGEFYLLMHHFYEWLLRNHSTNYICVFFNNYHASLYKIFFPNGKFIVINNLDVPAISRGVEKIRNMIDNIDYYVPFYEKYFRQVEYDIQNKEAHYYHELLKHLDLGHNLTNSYIISDVVKEKVNKILPLLNHKFILISPESGSNVVLTHTFWKDIYKYCRELGYEVFCNCTDMKSFIPGTISIFLNYEEMMELAKYATLIIGLRSGLLECIASPNVPLIVLYSDFPKRNGFKPLASNYVRKGFTLRKLDCLGKLEAREYDLNEINEKELLQQCHSDILNIINRR